MKMGKNNQLPYTVKTEYVRIKPCLHNQFQELVTLIVNFPWCVLLNNFAFLFLSLMHGKNLKSINPK